MDRAAGDQGGELHHRQEIRPCSRRQAPGPALHPLRRLRPGLSGRPATLRDVLVQPRQGFRQGPGLQPVRLHRVRLLQPTSVPATFPWWTSSASPRARSGSGSGRRPAPTGPGCATSSRTFRLEREKRRRPRSSPRPPRSRRKPPPATAAAPAADPEAEKKKAILQAALARAAEGQGGRVAPQEHRQPAPRRAEGDRRNRRAAGTNGGRGGRARHPAQDPCPMNGSPFALLAHNSVSAVMLKVLAALIPGIIAHAWFFGPGIWVSLLAVHPVRRGPGKPSCCSCAACPCKPFLSDGSVVVTACPAGALPAHPGTVVAVRGGRHAVRRGGGQAPLWRPGPESLQPGHGRPTPPSSSASRST
jgi:hypothetical protein